MVIAESKQAACDAVEMIIGEFSGDKIAALATDLNLDSPLVWDSGTDNIAAMQISMDVVITEYHLQNSVQSHIRQQCLLFVVQRW